MKSRLEGEIALCLDNLGIRWEYEPQSFLLPSGHHYWPDFYCPDIKQWIEGKGEINSYHIKLLEEFSQSIKTEIIIISRESSIHIDKTDISASPTYPIISTCPQCGKWYFDNQYGWWRCRICNRNFGDHYHYWTISGGVEQLKVCSRAIKSGVRKKIKEVGM